ncbi:TIM barrel protein [Roseobacter litoralis]|uniref:Xylose isomerase n=1 Tax=Roseobacter litoralis (strain ATCC 49566 / DSM 6996 / JCM 21268 / NBRC 15278 / OCh 149) TaxID=391595 RepID=F7ZKP1_ROSLO|nr:TIM barrel protein [Roseobacter litoralis]AEI92707.1 xylose isomerase family protein [Roseobacter litoralis Och 149]
MKQENTPLFAARLNAFKIGADAYWPGKNKVTTADLLARAATAGLTAADLNYPDHFANDTPAQLSDALQDSGMVLNGMAMRYYTDPGYKLGAFTHPDASVRRAAIDETKRGLDVLADMGGRLMTLWMGQDGFDYSFQMDYARAWENTIAAITEVADHNPDLDIALEYKPNEPRAFALMPDAATTLLALKEIDRPNTGVTLDFAHVLYADEMPAFAAALVARHSRILGVHLNDGYGKWDNGLMVGAVHPVQTIELLVELTRAGYDGAIYFDTFPDHSGLDPVAEARTNIDVVNRLRAIAQSLAGDADLQAAIARQDAPLSMRLVQAAMLK